jgi:hypothetical protein
MPGSGGSRSWPTAPISSAKSLETFSAQAKELAELGQKVATETVEPIKTSASKYYKPAA